VRRRFVVASLAIINAYEHAKKESEKCSDYKGKWVVGRGWVDGSEGVEQTAFMASSASIQLL